MTHPMKVAIFLRGIYSYLSPVLIMLGISIMLIGWLPKLVLLNYGYLILSFLIQYFGKLLKLPNRLDKITPFGFLDKVPVKNFDPQPSGSKSE